MAVGAAALARDGSEQVQRVGLLGDGVDHAPGELSASHRFWDRCASNAPLSHRSTRESARGPPVPRAAAPFRRLPMPVVWEASGAGRRTRVAGAAGLSPTRRRRVAGKAPRSHGRLARGGGALRRPSGTALLDRREPDFERIQVLPDLGLARPQLGLAGGHFLPQLGLNRLHFLPDPGLARTKPGLHGTKVLAQLGLARPHVLAQLGLARPHVLAQLGLTFSHVLPDLGLTFSHVLPDLGLTRQHVPAQLGLSVQNQRSRCGEGDNDRRQDTEMLDLHHRRAR